MTLPVCVKSLHNEGMLKNEYIHKHIVFYVLFLANVLFSGLFYFFHEVALIRHIPRGKALSKKGGFSPSVFKLW